jgi:subtilisin family serine protease
MKYEKIDAGISYSLKKYEQNKEMGLKNIKNFLGIKSEMDSPKPSRIVFFLECDENATFSNLEEYGIKINQEKGSIRTGICPLESIKHLQDNRLVTKISSSKFLEYKMDVATTRVQLPNLINSTGLSGNGVVIGIVDSGIDPKHPAFKGRILSIWDQTLSGDGVNEGKYGLELKQNLITSSRDEVGHGTHVAGISAGSNHNPFDGIARKSNLVIVKTDLDDTHIADGIRYIFRISREIGKPCVVNLSLGGHADPHDGTDDLSRIIDAESGPGRIVCCAAGNEGNDDIHSRVKVSKNNMSVIKFRIPPIQETFFMFLNCWYSGSNEFTISLKSPSGFVTPAQGILDNAEPTRYTLVDGVISIATPPSNEVRKDHNVLVIFDNSAGSNNIKSGIWELQIVGQKISTEGIFDAWIVDQSEMVFFTKDSADDSLKIGSPGCASKAITVGSFTSKVRWTDRSGNPHEVGLSLNDLSEFSSEGPLRDGSNKPDIIAPGAMIAATLSRDSTVKPDNVLNDEYRMMAGTSMATPFITGIVALILERDALITPEKIKDLLVNCSRVPGKEKGFSDPRWGHGLVDAELIDLP